MDRAIDQLKEASLSNDAEAQWELAICYAQGNGVEQSDAKAFEWICRAAENGKEEAENYVINAYENGSEELGIQPDMDKLAEWADKLSENGSAAMRIKYADLAMERKSNNINIIRAFRYVAELADKGNIACAFHAFKLGGLLAAVYDDNTINDFPHLERLLNYMKMLDGTDLAISEKEKSHIWYFYGMSLFREDKDAEAMHWFKLAIPHNANAEIFYASSLTKQAIEQGVNSPLWAESYNHFKHGVERNDCAPCFQREELVRSACHALAQQTRNGWGTPVDIDASYRWCARAAELGHEDAKRDLLRYHKKLFGGYAFK